MVHVVYLIFSCSVSDHENIFNKHFYSKIRIIYTVDKILVTLICLLTVKNIRASTFAQKIYFTKISLPTVLFLQTLFPLV